MAFKIQLQGMNAIVGHLESGVRMDAVKTVVKYHGAQMQGTAQICAPVKTGNLKDSIELELVDSGMTAIVEAGAEYGGYVEWGTRFMEAQPYMRPAYNQESVRFFESIRKLCR